MNFQIAVPLWLTHIRSDLVTTEDCSSTLHEYLLKYSDLHLEYFWRTSCYIYPPQNGQYWDAFPIFFLYLPPIWQTIVAELCIPMPSHLQG